MQTTLQETYCIIYSVEVNGIRRTKFKFRILTNKTAKCPHAEALHINRKTAFIFYLHDNFRKQYPTSQPETLRRKPSTPPQKIYHLTHIAASQTQRERLTFPFGTKRQTENAACKCCQAKIVSKPIKRGAVTVYFPKFVFFMWEYPNCAMY